MLEKQITKLQESRTLPEAADTSKYRDWLLKEERPTIQEQENVMRNRYCLAWGGVDIGAGLATSWADHTLAGLLSYGASNVSRCLSSLLPGDVLEEPPQPLQLALC